MATPSSLSLDEIRKYLIESGGSARNRDLVKHFKYFLTDPETRVEARNKFKEYVNALATIKNQEGEKYLVLKKKYIHSLDDLVTSYPYVASSTSLESPDFLTPTSPLRDPPPYRPPPPAPLSPSNSEIIPSPSHVSSTRAAQDQLYSNSPTHSVFNSSTSNLNITIDDSTNYPSNQIFGSITNNSNFVTPNQQSQQNISEINTDYTSPISPTSPIINSPPVPPRRKSQDKFKLENKENISNKGKNEQEIIKEDQGPPESLGTSELPSVRERMQRFNRMASETDLHGRPNSATTPTKKRSDKGTDEDDSASVASQQLDGKAREWLVRAAQGDYQALAKLAAEEPRLTRQRDPSSGTALHWAAKHGDENIVKLIAGTYKDSIKSVNETTNGGYTALHIAMQFDHENIFNLLVQVYGANQEIRDHSGKKARQYLASQEAAVSQDTFRKIKARKKHTEKDLGFLRIGSLNVRVKRTTEAFSQFLGVATNTNNEKIHKSWGSADNIQEHKMMPPPKYAPIKKRRSKRATDFSSRQQAISQPSTPLPQNKDVITNKSPKLKNKRPSSTTSVTQTFQTLPSVILDSDSDGACGFDSAWRGSAQL
ncbi:ankyrin repeat domain-containing protein SOWAHB isoform X2 [Cotesia glomerata]|uniref:ankyrin repeat domain-containing protein SOWAHB isoform X2 n=1 Tax=Cotesia glomerata TaxID=32391 RepID=UPI001D0040EE|nr:ankyrin repeat domain-containing protein SOWAHB isoform X2 [Cotesia glomerata]